MTYVMSDIHGDYERYIKMLGVIGFSGNDTLYIIGDICDRGEESERIYLDAMSKSNVICIKGNHEFMAESVLPYLLELAPMPNRRIYDANYITWLRNGAQQTINSLYRCHEKIQRKIVDFICEMPFYKTVSVGERHFTLVHAGLNNFSPEKSLDSYIPYDLVWARPNYDEKLWDDPNKLLIVGHTPTMYVTHNPAERIYFGKGGSIVNIDCGNSYRNYGGCLGCLCLDTMQEFYL